MKEFLRKLFNRKDRATQSNSSTASSDKLIEEYKAKKPEIDKTIQESGLLPKISQQDLQSDAYKGYIDVVEKLRNQKLYMDELDPSHSSNLVRKHLIDSANFYKFPLKDKYRPKTQKELKELMKKPNKRPDEPTAEKPSSHKGSSDDKNPKYPENIYGKDLTKEEASEITIPKGSESSSITLLENSSEPLPYKERSQNEELSKITIPKGLSKSLSYEGSIKNKELSEIKIPKVVPKVFSESTSKGSIDKNGLTKLSVPSRSR
jgi:hypothetical protein